MRRLERINDFLNLIKEIAKSNIEVDANLVYSNLIMLDSVCEPISNYFDIWIERFKDYKNIDVFVSNNNPCFCEFINESGNVNAYFKLKIYIPLNKKHIYKGVNNIFDYLSSNNIYHESKVSNKTRFDDVVIRLENIEDLNKLLTFINNDDYIKDGLILPNPFAFIYNNIAITWDGDDSYNMNVSYFISEYINELKSNGKLDTASYNEFYKYVCDKYNDIFVYGKEISLFAIKRKMENMITELTNCCDMTRILISALDPYQDINNFYKRYLISTDLDHIDELKNNISTLLQKEVCNKSNIEEDETINYACVKMCQTNGLRFTFDKFKYFIQTGDYRIFNRKGNIRKIIMNANITPAVLNNFVKNEAKKALMDASFATIIKYGENQLLASLVKSSNHDYSLFTNSEGVRDNLIDIMGSDSIDDVIDDVLLEKGYFILYNEDRYSSYVSLIKNIIKNNK